MKNPDILVIGGGIAGLSFAIKIAENRPDLSIYIFTKSSNELNNTAHAQGGIAVVLDQLNDSFEQHVEDTLKAGKGLCDKKVVETVVQQAPERLRELIAWGTSFDVDKNGALSLGLEGGHSQKRIVHQQDMTGREIEQKLISKAESFFNISFFDHYFVKDLLVEKENGNRTCKGVIALDKKKEQFTTIYSNLVFLATGGSGKVFKNTTNPSVATGDGVAMAQRAGATIKMMNYFQFHPTALYQKNQSALFLVSEAVRGFGAYVVNHNGERFLFQYDERGELATRDIVSAAIFSELKKSGKDHVYLDCRHLERESFEKHFPTIIARCKTEGLDAAKELIPVIPAAHYQCGGIAVNFDAKTSIKNLYASGECAHTGLHGANRLASNSLLEALVYSHQAANAVLAEINFSKAKTGPQIDFFKNKKSLRTDIFVSALTKKLHDLLTYELLYEKASPDQNEALDALEHMFSEVEKNEMEMMYNPNFLELKNLLSVAQLIMEHALETKEKSVELESIR